MHSFDGPPRLDELEGKVIEQLGVCGRQAEFAVIIRRADDAFTEMMLPDAIDHHARGLRILWTRDPSREFEASAAGKFWNVVARENLREATCCCVTELVVTTAQMYARIG